MSDQDSIHQAAAFILAQAALKQAVSAAFAEQEAKLDGIIAKLEQLQISLDAIEARWQPMTMEQLQSMTLEMVERMRQGSGVSDD